MPIEKRPGRDWTVTYRWKDADEVETMMVFGAATEADALADAHQSLGAAETGLRGAGGQ